MIPVGFFQLRIFCDSVSSWCASLSSWGRFAASCRVTAWVQAEEQTVMSGSLWPQAAGTGWGEPATSLVSVLAQNSLGLRQLSVWFLLLQCWERYNQLALGGFCVCACVKKIFYVAYGKTNLPWAKSIGKTMKQPTSEQFLSHRRAWRGLKQCKCLSAFLEIVTLCLLFCSREIWCPAGHELWAPLKNLFLCRTIYSSCNIPFQSVTSCTWHFIFRACRTGCTSSPLTKAHRGRRKHWSTWLFCKNSLPS